MSELICPFSSNILYDPIILPCCAITVNRGDLQICTDIHPTCPLCNQDISDFDIQHAPKNKIVYDLVDKYLKSKYTDDFSCDMIDETYYLKYNSMYIDIKIGRLFPGKDNCRMIDHETVEFDNKIYKMKPYYNTFNTELEKLIKNLNEPFKTFATSFKLRDDELLQLIEIFQRNLYINSL